MGNTWCDRRPSSAEYLKSGNGNLKEIQRKKEENKSEAGGGNRGKTREQREREHKQEWEEE